MTAFQRYVLFQIPGWILAVILLLGFRNWLGLPLWAALLILSLYVLKDFVLYPFLRVAYESKGRSSMEELVGARGVVKQALDPEGYVLLRGELWKARIEPGAAALEPGSRVRVRGVRGMTLTVVPE